jgi:hypothetical protein
MAETASPDSFHDANQVIDSPEDTATSAPATTPHGNNSNLIALQQGNVSSGDSTTTPSPLQQRQLFPTEANNNPIADGTSQYLKRHSSVDHGQESLNMSDVAEEEKEEGDDGDSAAEAVDAGELDSCYDEALRDRLECLIKKEGPEVDDGEWNGYKLKKGLPAEVSMPSVPSDWTPPIAKIEKGEPEFKDVDNPGRWPEFTYRSKFEKAGEKKGQYAHHSLPTGARPVPANQEGKRMVDGWEFYYDKWVSDAAANEKSRSGATNTAEVPECRKGRLDYDLLKKMKLTKKRIVEGDALFFLQLLLPIGDPKKSGIEDDPRMPYYSAVDDGPKNMQLQLVWVGHTVIRSKKSCFKSFSILIR